MQSLFLSPYIGTLTAFQTLGALAEGQLRAQYAISKTLIGMVGAPVTPAASDPTPQAKASAAKPAAKPATKPKAATKAKPARKPAPAKSTSSPTSKPAVARATSTPKPADKRPRAPSTPPSMPPKTAKKSG